MHEVKFLHEAISDMVTLDCIRALETTSKSFDALLRLMIARHNPLNLKNSLPTPLKGIYYIGSRTRSGFSCITISH